MKIQAIKSSFKWAFLGKFLLIISQLFITGIQARLFSPEIYGLFGTVYVVQNFVLMFKDMGLGAYLLHNKNISKELYGIINVLNVAIGVILMLTMWLLARPIADFYSNSLLVELVRAFSSIILIQSLGQISNIQARKRLAYRKIVIIENVSYLIGSFCTIGFALLDYGVWSLICGQIIAVSITTVMFVLSEDYPRLRFNFKIIKPLVGFSRDVTFEKIVNYLRLNIDQVIIGRVLSIHTLGFYNVYMNFVSMPVKVVSFTVKDVLAPSLTIYRDDMHSFKSLYFGAMRVTSLITLSTLTFVALNRNLIVSIILGDKWLVYINILPWLAFGAGIRSVTTLCGLVFLQTRNTRFPLVVNTIFLPLYCCVYYITSAYFGLSVLVPTAVLLYLIHQIILIKKTNSILGVEFFEYLKHFKLSILIVLSEIIIHSFFSSLQVGKWIGFGVELMAFLLVGFLIVLNNREDLGFMEKIKSTM